MNAQSERGADDETQKRACRGIVGVENGARRERARDGANECSHAIERVINDGDFVARHLDDSGNKECAQSNGRTQPSEMPARVRPKPEVKGEGKREKRQKRAQSARCGQPDAEQNRGQQGITARPRRQKMCPIGSGGLHDEAKRSGV